MSKISHKQVLQLSATSTGQMWSQVRGVAGAMGFSWLALLLVLGLALLQPAALRADDGSSNARVINQVYADLLGRAPSDSELSGWSDWLDQGNPRLEMALWIVYSAEAKRNMVNTAYQAWLGRPVDDDGLNGWLSMFQSGSTNESVLSAILGSAEYWSVHGEMSDSFVNALYSDVLRRSPTDGEFSAAMDFFNSDSADRSVAARGILTSVEYQQNLVQSYYQQFLHRPVDSSGINIWNSAMQSGMTDEQVIASIVGSNEYFALSQGQR